MQNRRDFLLQTTLAAGSILFFKSLKTAACSPVTSSISATEKLTILNLNTLQSKFQKVLFPPLSDRLPDYFKNLNCHTLLLSTANIASLQDASKPQLTKTLTWLKNAGCDAIVPNHTDLQNGLTVYTELTRDCELTSLGGNAPRLNNEIFRYHVVSKGKIKIGIIGNGSLNADPSVKSNVEEIAFRLNETAQFLKNHQACNLIVSMNPLYNSTKIEEKELATITTNIDVIVSSNSAHNTPVTYIVRNALRQEVVLNYQGVESPHLKGIDISFNSKYEKTNFALRRVM